jgi:hypothetical protein
MSRSHTFAQFDRLHSVYWYDITPKQDLCSRKIREHDLLLEASKRQSSLGVLVEFPGTIQVTEYHFVWFTVIKVKLNQKVDLEAALKVRNASNDDPRD